jgi:hypothetical protein
MIFFRSECPPIHRRAHNSGVTLVDRLTHHADVTKIEGESYRLRESELEAAARRKKK